MLIKNAKILDEQFQYRQADLVISDKIDRIIPGWHFGENETAGSSADMHNQEVIDLKGDILLPGLVDIHTHGAVGINVMDKDLDYASWKKYHSDNGVTTFFATTITEDFPVILNTLENLKQADGVYLEGPFLSAGKRGAHDIKKIRPVDFGFIEKIKDKIQIITIAPEIEGNMEAIKRLTSMGIRVAVGHSCADYETGKKAIGF